MAAVMATRPAPSTSRAWAAATRITSIPGLLGTRTRTRRPTAPRAAPRTLRSNDLRPVGRRARLAPARRAPRRGPTGRTAGTRLLHSRTGLALAAASDSLQRQQPASQDVLPGRRPGLLPLRRCPPRCEAFARARDHRLNRVQTGCNRV